MAHCRRCGAEFPDWYSDERGFCPDCRREQSTGEPIILPPESAEGSAAPPQPRRVYNVRQSLTMLLIVVNVLAFILELIVSRSLDPGIPALIRCGAAYGPLTMQGEWWRLFTSTFLHGGVMHILLNMWALFNVGFLAEIVFGRRNYLLLYLYCGIGGSLLSLWWHPEVVGVGASGAIFGTAGALIPAIYFERNSQVKNALRSSLTSIAIFVFFNLAYGAGSVGIDNAAHIGGLITGLILGALLPTATHPNFLQRRGRVLIVFAIVAVLMIVAARYAKTAHAGTLHFAQAMDLYSKGKRAEAIKQAQLAVQADPKMVDAHYLLGTLLVAEDRNEEAVPELQRAVQMRPDFADGHSQLCIAYLRSDHLRESVESCKRAVALQPSSPDYQFNLGLVYRVTGENHLAVGAFRKATQLKPEWVDSRFDLALSLLGDGQTEEAVNELKQLIAKHPDYKPAQQKLEQIEASSQLR